MLRWAYSLRDLSFSKLMEVYTESNMISGAESAPGETEQRQLVIAEDNFYQYLRNVFFPTEGARYAIWEENGKYLSAFRLEPFRDGLLLEALETAPDQRGKSYACCLISEALEELPNRKIYSHVHKKNQASLRTHQKLGFQIHQDYAVYIDGSVSSSAYTMLFEGKNILGK